LKNKTKLLFTLSLLWAFLILAIGAWWSYLLLKGGQTAHMIKWEGGTFFLLLILISGTLLYLYLKDMRKNKALQAFFSSMTHELKTPLASIRLQADAIDNYIKDLDHKVLNTLSHRMIEDTQNLEVKMDKILQLSRIEQGGNLNPTAINLEQFLAHIIKKVGHGLEVNLSLDKNIDHLLADEFALELVLKNLLENTKKHSKINKVDISTKKTPMGILLIYNDYGIFKGDPKKLGQLFYKHNSSSGSGIGLYLAKRLMTKIGGRLEFIFHPNLSFNLYFKIPEAK